MKVISSGCIQRSFFIFVFFLLHIFHRLFRWLFLVIVFEGCFLLIVFSGSCFGGLFLVVIFESCWWLYSVGFFLVVVFDGLVCWLFLEVVFGGHFGKLSMDFFRSGIQSLFSVEFFFLVVIFGSCFSWFFLVVLLTGHFHRSVSFGGCIWWSGLLVVFGSCFWRLFSVVIFESCW